MPASSPGWKSMTSRLKPRRSDHFRYMRSSISAQSCDSVPPAPGMDGDDRVRCDRARRRASSSSRPLRLPDCSSSSPAGEVGADVFSALRPFEEHGRGHRCAAAAIASSARSSSTRRRRCMTFCASAWLFQKVGLGDRPSRSRLADRPVARPQRCLRSSRARPFRSSCGVSIRRREPRISCLRL